MLPLTARWVRVYAVAGGVIGAFFLIVGLLSTWSWQEASRGTAMIVFSFLVLASHGSNVWMRATGPRTSRPFASTV